MGLVYEDGRLASNSKFVIIKFSETVLRLEGNSIGWSKGGIIRESMKSGSLSVSNLFLTGVESVSMVIWRSGYVLFWRLFNTWIDFKLFEVQFEVAMVNVEVVVVEGSWTSDDCKCALGDFWCEHGLKTGWGGFTMEGRVISKASEVLHVLGGMDGSKVCIKSEYVGIVCVSDFCT